MMRWLLLASLMFSCNLYAAYSTEPCDGDGYYAGIVAGAAARTLNYGGAGALYCYNDGTTDRMISVVSWSSITSQGNGTVSACTLKIYSSTVTAGGNVRAYLQLKPYFQGTADGTAQNGSSSWDEWYQHTTPTSDTLFTTKGSVAPTAWGDTGSVWNRNDATGDDRTGTAMSVQNVAGSTTPYNFVIDAAWLNSFMSGTIPQFTILLIPDAGTKVFFYERLDGDYGGVRSAILSIWWNETTTPTVGTGRFGRSQTGEYLNVR